MSLICSCEPITTSTRLPEVRSTHLCYELGWTQESALGGDAVGIGPVIWRESFLLTFLPAVLGGL